MSGPVLPARDWEAEIVVASNPPTKAEDIEANSTGNYVTSFNWGMRQ